MPMVGCGWLLRCCDLWWQRQYAEKAMRYNPLACTHQHDGNSLTANKQQHWQPSTGPGRNRHDHMHRLTLTIHWHAHTGMMALMHTITLIIHWLACTHRHDGTHDGSGKIMRSVVKENEESCRGVARVVVEWVQTAMPCPTEWVPTAVPSR